MNYTPVPGDGAALTWIKSSYSGADTASCVEVAWTKSSHSTPDGPDCVEVATSSTTILIRDSKNPKGPRLALTPATWTAFLPYASRH
jgi:hypothetical protein